MRNVLLLITQESQPITCTPPPPPHPAPIPSQIEAVEWPFEDNGSSNGKMNGNASFQNIADYLSQRKICLMINLPMRLHRTTPAITKGYITRRMAVEYSIPLITDIKCAKLAVKVCI